MKIELLEPDCVSSTSGSKFEGVCGVVACEGWKFQSFAKSQKSKLESLKNRKSSKNRKVRNWGPLLTMDYDTVQRCRCWLWEVLLWIVRVRRVPENCKLPKCKFWKFFEFGILEFWNFDFFFYWDTVHSVSLMVGGGEWVDELRCSLVLPRGACQPNQSRQSVKHQKARTWLLLPLQDGEERLSLRRRAKHDHQPTTKQCLRSSFIHRLSARLPSQSYPSWLRPSLVSVLCIVSCRSPQAVT